MSVLIAAIFVFAGCKKNTIDAYPNSTFQFSMAFNPEYPQTLTTNYGPDTMGYVQRIYKNTVPYPNAASFYTLNGRLSRKVLNPNGAYSLVAYTFAFDHIFQSTDINAIFAAGNYSYTATSNMFTSISGSLTSDQGIGWSVFLPNTPLLQYQYQQYPACSIKVVISKVYQLNLKGAYNQGKSPTKFADGSIDATMLGGQLEPVDGGPPTSANGIIPTQLHFTCNFTNVEIDE